MFAQGKGLMVPTGDLQQTLTAQAKTSRVDRSPDEVVDEFLAKEAAYVLFDEKELEMRRGGELVDDSIFEHFERERGLVCEGTDLLA